MLLNLVIQRMTGRMIWFGGIKDIRRCEAGKAHSGCRLNKSLFSPARAKSHHSHWEEPAKEKHDYLREKKPSQWRAGGWRVTLPLSYSIDNNNCSDTYFLRAGLLHVPYETTWSWGKEVWSENLCDNPVGTRRRKNPGLKLNIFLTNHILLAKQYVI